VTTEQSETFADIQISALEGLEALQEADFSFED